jgi:hypothetical protein
MPTLELNLPVDRYLEISAEADRVNESIEAFASTAILNELTFRHLIRYESAVERLGELQAYDVVSVDEARYIGPIEFLQDLTQALEDRIKAAEERYAKEVADEVAYEAACEAARAVRQGGGRRSA